MASVLTETETTSKWLFQPLSLQRAYENGSMIKRDIFIKRDYMLEY